MPLPDAAAAVLVSRYQEGLAAIADARTDAVRRAWVQAGTEEADQRRFEAAVSPIMAALTVAALRRATGFYSRLLGAAAPAIAVRQLKVPDETREPYIAFGRALNSGRSLDEALAAGAARAAAITRNRVISAARRTGDVFIETTGAEIVGWKRVLDGGACPWCISVSGQIYKTSASADFGHDRCGCSAVPVLA